MDPSSWGERAYAQKQEELAGKAILKQQRGEALSSYEASVLHDYRLAEGMPAALFIAAGVAGRAFGAAIKPTQKIFQAMKHRMAGKGLPYAERSTLGRALRAEAIPAGSKLEYLGPGKVRFDGVEFRAVRDLGHMSNIQLQEMKMTGKVPQDIFGNKLHGHHHQQRYHREPGAFIVEIPEPQHCISNPIQHPLGTSGGLSKAQRYDWDKLRVSLNKERAKTELLKRGLE